MFQALELRNQLAFALDAEGSDHYRDDLDYIPAINAAIKWVVAIINSAMGENKVSEEFFAELAYSGVFKTTNTSRVSFNVFPSEVWTLLAIYAKPELELIQGIPTTSTPDLKQSYFIGEQLHVTSSHSCKRLTLEEWAFDRKNPFEAGYEGNAICGEVAQYAYLSPINYQGNSTSLKSQEIEIRPKVVNDYVTIFWAKTPNLITSINDNIEFPNSVFQLLFDKALNYISYKQGDQTNIYSVSSNDVQQLIGLI